MGFYKVIDNVSPRFASDVNQYADALSGNADVGKIVLYAPISAPGALTAAVSSNAGVLTGAYQYVVCFLTGYWQGEPQTGTLIVQGNTGYGTLSAAVSPSGQQVNLTNIPIGPAGVVARLIGRTKAGGSTFYPLVQINDNTTTSWTDNTPDNGLGSTALTQINTTGTYLAPTTIASLTENIPAAGTVGIYNDQWYYSNGTAWVAIPSLTSIIPYAVDTGTANAYAVALSPAPSSLVDGMAVAVKIANTSTGASTLNVNGLGAMPIVGPLLNAITSGALVAGGIYTFRYNATNSQWVVQGGALQPATASVLGGVMIGQGVNVTSNGTISVNVFQHLAYWL